MAACAPAATTSRTWRFWRFGVLWPRARTLCRHTTVVYGTAKRVSTEPPSKTEVSACPRLLPKHRRRLPAKRRPLVGMGDARMVSAHQRESEQGVREVSSALFNRVTNYHAQIGANVNKETLQSLEWQVLCHHTL